MVNCAGVQHLDKTINRVNFRSASQISGSGQSNAAPPVPDSLSFRRVLRSSSVSPTRSVEAQRARFGHKMDCSGVTAQTNMTLCSLHCPESCREAYSQKRIRNSRISSQSSCLHNFFRMPVTACRSESMLGH